MNRKQLSYAFIGATLMLMLGASVMPAQGAFAITTRRDVVKANVPFDVTTTGLTVATYYTVYVDSTLYRNRSASATSLDWEIVLGADYIDANVDIELKSANGSTTHATLTVYVEDVIPQYLPDMIGGFLPYIAGFTLVSMFFGVIVGLGVVIGRMMKGV